MPPDESRAEPICAFGFASVQEADVPVLLSLTLCTLALLTLGWLGAGVV